MPAVSKITVKGQTTVPQKVREALKTKPGDLLAWEVQSDGRVAVRRFDPPCLKYWQAVQGTLGEWRTADDERAYGKL